MKRFIQNARNMTMREWQTLISAVGIYFCGIAIGHNHELWPIVMVLTAVFGWLL